MKKLLFSALLLVAGVMSVSAIDIAKWTFDTGYDESSRIYTPNNAAWAEINVGNNHGAPTFRPQIYVGTQSDYALTGKMTGSWWSITDKERFLLRFSNSEANNITNYTDASQHNNYFEASFPTRGYININVSFTIGDGGSSSAIAKVVYSVDGGNTWQLKGDYKMGAHWGTYNPGSFDFTDMNNKDNVIVRLILENGKTNNYNLKYFYVSGTSDPSASATLISIDVDGKNYAANTAVANTFTITDQVFTKNPVVKFNDSKGNTQNVTMTAHNDGTATGSFSVGGTDYDVVANNVNICNSPLLNQYLGTTTNSGKFNDPNKNGDNKNTNWTPASGSYSIDAAQAPGRFSPGWWGSPSIYGYCIGNATLTFNVPANVRVDAIEVIGAAWNDNTTITAGAGYTLPTNNKVVNTQGTPNGSSIMILVDNPTYGAAPSINISSQINCYFKIYGVTAENTNVTIGSAGYATFVAPFNLDFTDSEVIAYAVTPVLAENKVTLSSVDKVPAGKAIVVKGAEGTHSIPATASAEDFSTSLEVSATATVYDNEYTYYYLGVDNGQVGFRPLANGGSIAAGKCFFKVATTPASARFMRIATEGETTGIKAIESAKNNAVVYNLAGQRVAANAKGIVIMNGKKMLNK